MLRTAAYLGACLACLLSCQGASAARVVHAEISLLGGRVVLLDRTGDDGRADGATVWSYLKDRVTFGDGRGVLIRPDPDNPLQATLQGEITVSIQYGGQAEVTKLRLIRDKDTDHQWRIHPEDVEAMWKRRK